jgi:hypothetical protein
MHKRVLAAAVVVAGGCAAGITAAVTDGATGPAQIRITDTQSSRALIRPRGGGITGTVEVITQRLYNPSLSPKPIGRGQLVCTYVDRRNRTCISTYVLPKGTLVVVGETNTRLLYELPIVGGTGLFDNAHGSLTVTASHLKPRHEVLVFRLLG